jgi:hypothetical protein
MSALMMGESTFGIRLDARMDADLRLCRIILETDGTAIASRVSRPKADASDIVINEQTIMNACKYLVRLLTVSFLIIPHRLVAQGANG